MRVKCLHGYFIFEEQRSGQLSDFMSITGLALVPKNQHYTFEALLECPDFTLVGQDFLGVPAIATYEGQPWELFEENQMIYHFGLELMMPIAAITQRVKLDLAGNRFISDGLILPGSITQDGNKVKNYSGWFSRETLRWYYSEVEYVEST